MKVIFKILISVVFSVVLLLNSYRWSNNSITNGEEEKLVTDIAFFFEKYVNVERVTNYDLEDIVCINISNDRELVTVTDIIGGQVTEIVKGVKDITDRHKLSLFLNKTNNKHKYIFLDVDFDSKYQSPNDSLLQEAFNRVDNIIIPSHYGDQGNLISNNFNVRKGFAAYKKSIFSNRFIKYTFLENDTIESLAYNASKTLNSTNIKKEGNYFYDNGKLCLNSIILNHYINPIKKFDINYFQNFKELGVDVLDVMTDNEIERLVKDKIVLIGDFDDRDMHITSVGKMPGVLIHYNAYLSLIKQSHQVPKGLIINLLLVYLIITIYLMFYLDKKIPIKFKTYFWNIKMLNRIKNKFGTNKLYVVVVTFFDNFFNYFFTVYLKIGFVLIAVSVLFYLIYGIHVEILRTSLSFGTLVLIRDLLTKKKLNEKKA
ncbi:MAG: CHASE2 domain-containing protein [Algicola sp.]|nr:CHASE2 domain-containing protein [Algicola sp.]